MYATGALAKYWNDPKVLEKFGKAMGPGSMPGMPGVPGMPGELETQGDTGDADNAGASKDDENAEEEEEEEDIPEIHSLAMDSDVDGLKEFLSQVRPLCALKTVHADAIGKRERERVVFWCGFQFAGRGQGG